MAVVGCTIFYDDNLDLLERCLASLRARVDTLVAVDGAFASFPHERASSSEAHLQVARRYADVLWTTGVPWHDEVEKRNAYLEHVDNGDWALVLDADEELHGELGELDSRQVGYDLLLHQSWLKPRGVFRLFQKWPGVRYKGAHNAVFNARGDLLNLASAGTLPGLTIEHHTWERPPARVEAKGVYIRALAERERAFREEHRL